MHVTQRSIWINFGPEDVLEYMQHIIDSTTSFFQCKSASEWQTIFQGPIAEGSLYKKLLMLYSERPYPIRAVSGNESAV